MCQPVWREVREAANDYITTAFEVVEKPFGNGDLEPLLIQGVFWLDVFLPIILRRECDSHHKRPKANFLSSEVNATSLTGVCVVLSTDLFCPTLRASTMP